MKLVSSSLIECKREALDTFVQNAQKVLSKMRVNAPVIVNRQLEVIGNNDICDTLKRLGARFVPVVFMEEVKDIDIDLRELGFYEDIKPSEFKVFSNIHELIRGLWPTPLVRIKLSEAPCNIDLYLKLEGFNPLSMSVKDRIAWYMVMNAAEDILRSGKRKLFMEPTSTNTGLGITLIGNTLGFKTRLFIPRTVQKESEAILKIAGADVKREDKQLTVEMIDEVKELASRGLGVMLNQFENDLNLEAHLRFTAKELDVQLQSIKKKLLGIVGGIGTSGHMSALSIYFKSRYPSAKIIAAQPAPGTSIQGIRRAETGMKWLKYAVFDHIIDVHPKEAVDAVKKVAIENGLLIGPSSGAAVHAALKAIEKGLIPDEKGVVVVVSPDMGHKYGEFFSQYLD
jgi:cysteine synthase/O-phosphoserine sulfhydrylase/cystathionine beta-synthase